MNNFKEFANSFQTVARLRLESIRELLEFLGNPQKELKFIHVAGTNGKGSVCSFLACIFNAAGYRTGKYISPNLIDVCERISINGKDISENELGSVLLTVERASEKVKKKLGEYPTQFEIWTAAAFCYFKEKKCDVVILETGLGGENDATNIIPPPLASVICKIGYDHMNYLGGSIAEIAKAKAGIIKKREGSEGLTVCAEQPFEDAARVIEEVCRKQNNKLVIAKKPDIIGTKGFNEIFSYRKIEDLKCGITGFYQPENAALAIETALSLGIEPKYIKHGIEFAKNPARFEIISENPLVIYDGAHNGDGIRALIASLKRYFPKWNGAVFINAFMADKDISGFYNEIKKSELDMNSDFYAVKVKNNQRSETPENICKIAEESSISVLAFSSLKEAYMRAINTKKMVILCGSLYLYKDFAEVLAERTEGGNEKD